MIFRTHFLSPTNTGAPDYNICGQAAPVVSFTNLKLKVKISTNNSDITTLVDTTDLSTYTVSGSTINFANFDVVFTSIAKNAGLGLFQITLDIKDNVSARSLITKKLNFHIEVEQTGYTKYNNIFEIYNYDIGVGVSGEADIFLLNTTNLYENSKQIRAFSKMLTIPKPFTDEIHLYNMVGTEGVITYKELNTNITVGNGNHAITNMLSNTTFEQTIEVFNYLGISADICTSEVARVTQQWLPTMLVTSSNTLPCSDTINSIDSVVTVNTVLDYTSVAHNVTAVGDDFLSGSALLYIRVKYELFDYTGVLIETEYEEYTIDYTAFTSNPTDFLLPLQYEFTPSNLGINIVKATLEYANDEDFEDVVIYHRQTLSFDTCNWWTVEKTDSCNKFTIQNCSLDTLSLEVQQLSDDKVFVTISTTTLTSLASTDITFDETGLYVFKVTRDAGVTYEYYTVINFCNVEICFNNYLLQVMCNPVLTDCASDVHSNFNAFIITFHSLMLMLNSEFNFNFIYTAIDVTKLNELYRISQLIKRLDEYCDPLDSNCLPCNS